MKVWFSLLICALACNGNDSGLRKVPAGDYDETDHDGGDSTSDDDTSDEDNTGDNDDPSGWFEVGGSHPNAIDTRYTTDPVSGGVSNTAADSRGASVAVDSSGRPCVAWEEDSDEGAEIYYRQWNGSGWAALGGSASGGGVSNAGGFNTQAVLVLDGDDRPVIAWRHNNTGDTSPSIYVRRWNGTSWVELAGSGSGDGVSGSAGVAYLPDLTLNPDGYPVLAWQDERLGTGKMRVHVAHFDGSAWQGYGGALSSPVATSDGATDPSIAVDAQGHPAVAWVQTLPTTDTAIVVRAYTGSAWQFLASGGTALDLDAAYAQSPEAAVTSTGDVVVSWQTRQHGSPFAFGVALAMANEGIFGEPETSITSNYARLGVPYYAIAQALDGGTPYIAFINNETTPDDGYEVYLKTKASGAWDELSGSASDGGISNSSSDSIEVSVGVGGGRVCVAWTEGVSLAEVFLRCHDL